MKFLVPALPLEQPLHSRITTTGRGKCPLSWSPLASQTRVMQAGGHHGQGTTMERVSLLPAPTAEQNQPEIK